jgi:PST family polysaccharide transporter
MGAGISVVLYMRIDQTMLGALSGARETGLYSIAVALSEVSFFVPVVLFTVMTPGMSRLHARDPIAYGERLQALFSLAIATAYVSIAIGLLVAPWLIPVVYGREYENVTPVFLLLLPALPFVSIGVVQSMWTAHAGRQEQALVRTLSAAIINIALNVLLLPRFGARGAAVTTVIAYAVAGCAANAFIPACRGVLRMQLQAFRLIGLRSVLSHGGEPA